MTAQASLRTSTMWRQNTMPCSANLNPRTSPLCLQNHLTSKSKFLAWLFTKMLLYLLLLLLLLKEEILLSATYTHLCTPSSCSPLSPSLVPFYCTVSPFRSLIWQKTNSAIKKEKYFYSKLVTWTNSLCDEYQSTIWKEAKTVAWSRGTLPWGAGSLILKATSLFRWVQL